MKRRHALMATGAAGALILGGLSVAALPASAAATGCSVTYKVQSQWSGGFNADVAITNLGAAVRGWTLTFGFPDADQKVTNGWNATVSQSGQNLTATNAAYNATIAPGANTSFGFQGTFASNDSSPTSFSVNGTPCS